MRFAYRVRVKATFKVDAHLHSGLFSLWLDAGGNGTGKVLQLVPLTSAATAKGDMIARDPEAQGATNPVVEFPIDDPVVNLAGHPGFLGFDCPRSSIVWIDTRFPFQTILLRWKGVSGSIS